LFTGSNASDLARQITRILHGFAIDCRDHVAGLDASLGSRAILLRRSDECALLFGKAERSGDILRHRLYLDADPATFHRALLDELVNNLLCGRGRNCKRNAHATARRREDGGVDADDLTRQVEGRTTGVALVHGCVDLDEVIVRTGADIAATSRHDAGSHRAAKTERITHSNHPVTDANLVIVAECDIGELLLRIVDLEYSQIGARIGADQLRIELGAIVHHDAVSIAVGNDVIVGYDIAVFRNEET